MKLQMFLSIFLRHMECYLLLLTVLVSVGDSIKVKQLLARPPHSMDSDRFFFLSENVDGVPVVSNASLRILLNYPVRFQDLDYAGKRFASSLLSESGQIRSGKEDDHTSLIPPRTSFHSANLGDRMPRPFFKRASMVDRMPISFGKKSSMVDRMPMSFGKRASLIDRMPISFGRRASLVSRMPMSFGRRASMVDRMPMSFGKKRTNLVDRMPMSFGKRAGMVDRMPMSFGKRDSLIDRMPMSFGKRDSLIDRMPMSFGKRVSLVDRMPMSFGKRASMIDRMPMSFGKRSSLIDRSLLFEKRASLIPTLSGDPDAYSDLQDDGAVFTRATNDLLGRMFMTFRKRAPEIGDDQMAGSVTASSDLDQLLMTNARDSVLTTLQGKRKKKRSLVSSESQQSVLLGRGEGGGLAMFSEPAIAEDSSHLPSNNMEGEKEMMKAFGDMLETSTGARSLPLRSPHAHLQDYNGNGVAQNENDKVQFVNSPDVLMPQKYSKTADEKTPKAPVMFTNLRKRARSYLGAQTRSGVVSPHLPYLLQLLHEHRSRSRLNPRTHALLKQYFLVNSPLPRSSRSRVGRMPLTYGKRDSFSSVPIQHSPTAFPMLLPLQRRSRLDRMPLAYGKRSGNSQSSLLAKQLTLPFGSQKLYLSGEDKTVALGHANGSWQKLSYPKEGLAPSRFLQSNDTSEDAPGLEGNVSTQDAGSFSNGQGSDDSSDDMNVIEKISSPSFDDPSARH